MDFRQAIQAAMASKRHPEVAPKRASEEVDEEIGELVVAEYVIFLLALDTYIRYVEETTKKDDPDDDVIQKGIRLLRAADSELERIQRFLEEQLPSATHKKMVAKYLTLRASTSEGVGRRALGLRTVLSRGGTATMRAVFESNRALKAVRDAMGAAMLDDADAALDLFAKIVMTNTRLKGWIKLAADTAVSGPTPVNAVEVGAREAADTKTELLTQSIQQIAAPGAEASKIAQEAQIEKLVQVQEEATQAARQAMERSKEPDEPLTKSEIIGVAVAAAVAATSDPSNAQNVPETLRGLDDEQRAAALTDGKVGCFAGAGSGKSTTLVARVAHLVIDRRANPSRILVTSFNNNAAGELRTKIGRAAGDEAAKTMSVGTMHSLFCRFVKDFGTPAERAAVTEGFVKNGDILAYAAQKIWKDCYGQPDPDTKEEKVPPPLKSVLLQKSKWSGNNISPAQALAEARSDEEVEMANWYQIYEGLKGTAWRPSCPSQAYQQFMNRRPNVARLGDYSDMVKIFRDILERNPAVRKKVQGMYDHIIVDEAQDRNQVMADIIDFMSEHITDGSDGKSVWIVGDDKQCINEFMGARPALFKDLFEKEGWKTRVIRTNYRCEPEIVEAGNRLIAFNDGNVPIPQVAAPGRMKGVGSVQVAVPQTDAGAAIRAITEIKANQVLGEDLTDHAVLCRTNRELHSYETACILRGIPYARNGKGSFLGSPETSAMLGYVQLVTGTDFEKMQKAVGLVINNPNRFFLTDKTRAPEAVSNAFTNYARYLGVDKRSINPTQALVDSTFAKMLAKELGPLTRTGNPYKFDEIIMDLGYGLQEIQGRVDDEKYLTTDLFDDILGLKGYEFVDGKKREVSFRDSLTAHLRDSKGDSEEDAPDDAVVDEETVKGKGLGNIEFLYQLADIDPTDPDDDSNPPTKPIGFAAKMTRYAAKSRDLRTDIGEWNAAQRKLPPEQRRPPPGVYLSTVHKTKGAQWKTAFVQMPAGTFPMQRKPKPGEPPIPPEMIAEQLESERRLGYVAMTRAIKNLRILCPARMGGMPAGVSPFVDEAGLNIGENVQPLPGVAPPPVAEPTEPAMSKEASWEE